MNFHRPIPDYSAGAELAAPAAFARAPQFGRKTGNRAAGIVGVILVHGLLALLYFVAGPNFVRTEQQSLSVIDVPLELPKEIEPPPPPKFLPPEVYIPIPVIPLITLADPPPTPDAMTLPPPPLVQASVAAPLAQSPPPVPLEGDARKAYVTDLMKHLNRFKRYPDSAKLRHEQGVVSLRFSIDRNGHVLASSITRSSGSKALDAEVLEAVKRADPLPRIPQIFGREQLDLIVPVEFVLR
jgi:protein TonB